MPFDLFLGVPVHKIPAVVEESGLAEDGWIPVNPLSLQTAFSDVYAVGDVTSVRTPKAGVFAEGQASVVADQIIHRVRTGSEPTSYDGHGICYLEFGDGTVATVEVTFLSGAAPGETSTDPLAIWPRPKPSSERVESSAGLIAPGPAARVLNRRIASHSVRNPCLSHDRH